MREVDLNRTLASLQSRNVTLDVNTGDLCFLVALRQLGDRSASPSFDEEALFDIYEQVCDLIEPGAQNPRKRAAHALQRLRDQRLLGRIDGNGVISSGEYAMTRLASAIVDFFIEDDALSRESLSILTKALLWQLGDVKACAQRREWDQVVLRLRVAVGDLVAGIERRQQGLDAQQHDVRARIAALLREDWFAAVDACEALLEETAVTLGELHDMLLQDATLLHALLHEIERLAMTDDGYEAQEAALRAMEHVDRVCAWGGSRQAAWSDYYQYVQRYLRTVVRLDPQRAVSQRLQEHVSSYVASPYALVFAQADPTLVLRDPDRRPVRAPVSRPRAPREAAPDLVDAASQVPLSETVASAVDDADRLSQVLERLLPDVPAPRRYLYAGRITGEVARIRRVSRGPWNGVLDLQVEDWELRAK